MGSVCPGWDCSSPLLQAWLEASNPRVVEETPRSSAHLLAAQIKKLGPGEASAQARICEVRPSPGPWRPSPGFSSHATVMYTFCHLAPRPTVFSEVSQQCLTLQVLQTSPRIRCPQHTITWVSSSLSVQFKPPLAIALAGGRCGEEALKVMPCPQHPPSTTHQVFAYIASGVTHRMGNLRTAVAGKAAVDQACISPGRQLDSSE